MANENNGLFDLSMIESTGEDDLLKLNVYAEDVSVTVPGGNVEKPSSTGIEITADTYNAALAALKKSFHEGAAIMEMLEKVTVVNPDIDALQEDYTESCVTNAILESYMSGPYFEAVVNTLKPDIVRIIKLITNEYHVKKQNEEKDDKYGFKPFRTTHEAVGASVVGSAIGIAIGTTILNLFKIPITTRTVAEWMGVSIGSMTGAAIGNTVGKAILLALRTNKKFTAKVWQMVGCFNSNGDSIEECIKFYDDKFKDKFDGRYVLNAMKLKYNWVNDGGNNKSNDIKGDAYILILDTEKAPLETITIDPEDINSKKGTKEKDTKDPKNKDKE